MPNIVKMNAKKDHICRLCLKPVAKQFREVDELVKQLFDVVLLKLDFNITRDPIIGQDCIGVAKKWLDFKLTCIGTEKIIQSFSNSRENAKHDIKVIYEGEGIEHIVTDSDEDLDICRFCFTCSVRNNFASLYVLMNESMLEILSRYMPEMSFNTIENPKICTSCKRNIESYFKFAQNCFDVEEKIKAYRKKLGTSKISHGKLVTPSILEFPETSARISVIKDEFNIFENAEYTDSETNIKLMKLEEVLDIKAEEINLEVISGENLTEVELDTCGNKFTSKEFDIEMESHMSLLENDSKIKIYKCSLCSYEGKKNKYLKYHMLTHKGVSEIKMHQCSLCPYEGKRKCLLRSHMLVHKNVSEIKTYRCALCAYEAKRKNVLNNHMLTHKDISEIKMYKCSLCAYEGKQKSYLHKHMLTHKNVTEINMYKCSICAYEAKRKVNLIRHMLVHQDITEIKMYKCSLCAYEAKRKRTLDVHMLVHKDVSEIKTYKCSLCACETKQKSNLKAHILSAHKDVSEIEMHKCSLCAYEAKRKDYLKKHMSTHKVCL